METRGSKPTAAQTEPGSSATDPLHYWNEVVGPAWVTAQPLLDLQLEPLGRATMERLVLAPGQQVLDVGCGCGASTLEIAERVGPAGTATGIDVSRPMLARARARAKQASVENVRFLELDAESAALGAACYDAIYSRFGVMFFTDPEAAFGNLGRALRPGGRLAFVCWQALERNAWLTTPLAAAARVVPLPAPPPPGAPGMFSFADSERVRAILAAAGFERIRCQEHRGPLAPAGGEPEAAVELFLQVSPVAAALRESGADGQMRAAVGAAVRQALRAHETLDGIRMPCAAWIVTAERP